MLNVSPDSQARAFLPPGASIKHIPHNVIQNFMMTHLVKINFKNRIFKNQGFFSPSFTYFLTRKVGSVDVSSCDYCG